MYVKSVSAKLGYNLQAMTYQTNIDVATENMKTKDVF
jgi:hypothetical protein